jgi:hypothetical protein
MISLSINQQYMTTTSDNSFIQGEFVDNKTINTPQYCKRRKLF